MLLGGLFSSLQLYPFMRKTTIQYGDFNSIEKSGFYHVNGTTENRPSNVDSKLLDWGILVVYEVYSTQIFIPTNYSSFVFIRTKTPSGFNKWTRFEGNLLTV